MGAASVHEHPPDTYERISSSNGFNGAASLTKKPADFQTSISTPLGLLSSAYLRTCVRTHRLLTASCGFGSVCLIRSRWCLHHRWANASLLRKGKPCGCSLPSSALARRRRGSGGRRPAAPAPAPPRKSGPRGATRPCTSSKSLNCSKEFESSDFLAMLSSEARNGARHPGSIEEQTPALVTPRPEWCARRRAPAMLPRGLPERQPTLSATAAPALGQQLRPSSSCTALAPPHPRSDEPRDSWYHRRRHISKRGCCERRHCTGTHTCPPQTASRFRSALVLGNLKLDSGLAKP
mmetsp:Transcript_24222/g.36704  ORF Transcript_24222/g.36704 Transcript_24222/m.36704 type:complete len:293 (+) Transcript_24222:95-973(+)